jgi:hypothetical protein
MAIPFTILNLDKPRKLRFGMGAMMEFEQLTGIKLASLNEDIEPAVIGKILWVMLKQDDESLTLKEMCRIIDEHADSLADIISATGDAVQAAFATGKSPNAGKPTA